MHIIWGVCVCGLTLDGGSVVAHAIVGAAVSGSFQALVLGQLDGTEGQGRFLSHL